MNPPIFDLTAPAHWLCLVAFLSGADVRHLTLVQFWRVNLIFSDGGRA